ncbi:ABC transporter ATP-binding protein [Nocardioides sp. GY 10113]|nr:ABC transporter ATP-binding protein [Nocardioides sp. GY 10113]
MTVPGERRTPVSEETPAYGTNGAETLSAVDPAVKDGAVVLDVRHLTLKFGGLTALDDVSFQIQEGEILGLIGPNGAGKTTCFNAVTGVYKPTSGDIVFEGESVVGLKKHKITQKGIARTFQNIRLFPTMTALENVLVGTDAQHRTGMLSALFRLPRHRQEEERGHRRAMELLRFMGIVDKADELASNLSYGDQRRLEIARAMATEPKLICLDEPAAGFNPAEKVQLMELIRKVRDQGYTVLLIEHDMKLVMGVTDRIVVLEFGRKIAEGRPSEIRDNPAVIAAYLGVDEEDAS